MKIEPWKQMNGEPNRWYQRFEAFRLMGPGRSVLAVVNAEKDKKGQKRTTNIAGAWREPVKKWKWVSRAEAWDQAMQAEAARLAEEERAQVLAHGFAKDYKRVQALDELADYLRDQIANPTKVWLLDVKSINNQRVNLEHFNTGLIDQYRATLDDIAAEMGQRQKTQLNENIDLSGLNIDQLDRIAKGEDPRKVIATPGKKSV